ncbi:MAG: protein kinase [Deltaproteobacteria bacterium]|nr:protein kinase [Deltaproteobacteria bacterium]
MRAPIPFGRHLLLERFAVGGMAEVFRAKSFGVEGFERIVAVKRILASMAEDQEFIRMFIDEARIASYLTHQNIVQIYEFGKHEGVYYISMEYVAGRDLRTILDRQKKAKRPMDPAMACYVTSRVSEALDYAHRKKDPTGKDYKIIHRDVSPQNVIISYEGEVKLCDFGIAKAVTQSTRTQVGVLKGKFAYMSPEQVRGRPIDRRSDLFALGVILYEMLTGERLFLGDSDYATLEAVRAARIPPPRDFNPALPERLEAILLKLLAREPDQRYQWASELLEDLHGYLVSSGQIFHAHNLRQFIQDAYAKEIAQENAKLEAFMSLKLSAPGETQPGQPGQPRGAPVKDILGQKAKPEDASHEDASQSGETTAETSAEDLASQDALPALPAGPSDLAESSAELASTLMNDEEDSPFADAYTVAEAAKGSAGAEPDESSFGAAPTINQDDPSQTIAEEVPLGSKSGLAREIEAAQAALIEQMGQIREASRPGSPQLKSAAQAVALPSFRGPSASMRIEPATAPLDDEIDPTRQWVPPSEAALSPDRSRPTPTGSPRLIRERLRPSDPTDGPTRTPAPVLGGTPLPLLAKRDTLPPAAPPAPFSAPIPSTPVASRAVVTIPPRRAVLWVPALIALATLLLVLVLLLMQQPAPSLHLATTPVTDVEVYLDGKLAAVGTPVELPDLAIGEHTIEVRAVGHRPYRQTFQIAERRPHTLTIPLETDAPAPRDGSPPAEAAQRGSP